MLGYIARQLAYIFIAYNTIYMLHSFTKLINWEYFIALSLFQISIFFFCGEDLT